MDSYCYFHFAKILRFSLIAKFLYQHTFYITTQFYNNGTKDRVKDVNNLLTIEDKANLKLITTLIK
jgi:hypothetical protein